MNELLFDLPEADLSGLNPEKFDASWRAVSKVEPCSVADVERFMQEHYLRKRPAIVLLCVWLTIRRVPVGACVFAAPPEEANKRYGGEVWELARLYLTDPIPKNAETFLIAKATRYIQRNHRAVDFLLSYADPTAGHRGTIYRAANWIPDGDTDDERKTPRFDYADGHTGKKYGRRGNVPKGADLQRIPRAQKHRFYFPLK